MLLAKLSRIFGFFTIPEEVAIPAVIRQRDVNERRIGRELEQATLERLLSDENARQAHFAAVLPRPPPARGKPDVAFMTARAKIADARNLQEALGWLAPPERLAVLSDHDLFHALVRLEAGGEHTPDRPALRSA